MNTLSVNEMSDILGGGVWKNVATVACGVVGLGSAVYYIGLYHLD